MWCICLSHSHTAGRVGLQMYEQKANIHELMKMGNSQNHSEELTHENIVLNFLLGFILKFGNFPVSEYYVGREWQPCQKGWILFQKKCYMFFDLSSWKTWEGSQQHCQSKSADLVVVDYLEEQEFLSNHSTFYYDKFHGYWLGLTQRNNSWKWNDGRNDTLGYWMKTEIGGSGPYALLIPGSTPTESWDTSDAAFQNKFICEQEALIKPETKANMLDI
ncbi:hypothetical protein CHARACLAT_025803 [Characodon lateralis]|uniref:C-type lectin domain-containing protein n=1 Tax=Characodon lateralis TaxID=208331 RepID=A0ABU7DY71_9TELE|nr:hypothetical protein [Characodon lateralis]